MIDLTKHEGFIYKKLHTSGFPQEDKEDSYQDFCAFFYERYKENDVWGETTIIGVLFKNWLTERARKFNCQKTPTNNINQSINDFQEGWLEHNSSAAIREDYDDMVILNEVWDMISTDLKDHLLFMAGSDGITCKKGNPLPALVERDGVSRQAVQKRIKQELEALRNTLNR